MTGAREIARPDFGDDTGETPPQVAEALAAYDADPGDPELWAGAVTCLQESRLLVPVVAVADEIEQVDGDLPREKSSHMAAALISRPDGRRGLLAFTGSATMQRWRPDARPVPVPTEEAARAALADGAVALLVDLAGPARLVVQGEDLEALAAGMRLVDVGGRRAWIGSRSE